MLGYTNAILPAAESQPKNSAINGGIALNLLLHF